MHPLFTRHFISTCWARRILRRVFRATSMPVVGVCLVTYTRVNTIDRSATCEEETPLATQLGGCCIAPFEKENNFRFHLDRQTTCAGHVLANTCSSLKHPVPVQRQSLLSHKARRRREKQAHDKRTLDFTHKSDSTFRSAHLLRVKTSAEQ